MAKNNISFDGMVDTTEGFYKIPISFFSYVASGAIDAEACYVYAHIRNRWEYTHQGILNGESKSFKHIAEDGTIYCVYTAEQLQQVMKGSAKTINKYINQLIDIGVLKDINKIKGMAKKLVCVKESYVYCNNEKYNAGTYDALMSGVVTKEEERKEKAPLVATAEQIKNKALELKELHGLSEEETKRIIDNVPADIKAPALNNYTNKIVESIMSDREKQVKKKLQEEQGKKVYGGNVTSIETKRNKKQQAKKVNKKESVPGWAEDKKNKEREEAKAQQVAKKQRDELIKEAHAMPDGLEKFNRIIELYEKEFETAFELENMLNKPSCYATDNVLKDYYSQWKEDKEQELSVVNYF